MSPAAPTLAAEQAQRAAFLEDVCEALERTNALRRQLATRADVLRSTALFLRQGGDVQAAATRLSHHVQAFGMGLESVEPQKSA